MASVGVSVGIVNGCPDDGLVVSVSSSVLFVLLALAGTTDVMSVVKMDGGLGVAAELMFLGTIGGG